MGSGDHARNVNTNALTHKFFCEPTAIGGGAPLPLLTFPSGWFNASLGANFRCTTHEEIYCEQFGDVECQNCVDDDDKRIAKREIENGDYTEETRWMFEQRLYNKLVEMADSLPADSLLEAFLLAMDGTAAPALKEVSDGRQALFAIDDPTVEQLADERSGIVASSAELNDIATALAENTLSSEERGTLEAAASAWKEDIQERRTNTADVMGDVANDRALRVEGTESANMGIIASTVMESNERVVNAVYLATIARDQPMSSDDGDDLLEVALQCPMLGGNAVFRARALYSLLDEDMQYDDSLLCVSAGLRSLTWRHPGPAVQVVPNPARDEATLLYELPAGTRGELRFHDASGRPIKRVSIGGGAPRTAFSVSDLSNGVYQYLLVSGGEVLGQGKLTVVR